MKIYLAARYSRREELCGYKADLEALGHTVTSRWLLGNHQISDLEMETLEDEMIAEKRRVFAEQDYGDLTRSAITISFTEVPRSSTSRGGRHVEFGLALAIGQECWIVGPRENVFHCLNDVRVFPDWQSALEALIAEGANRGA